MKNYNGKWIDLFDARVYNSKDRPGCKGKILLETPDIDYLFTPEQWKQFKEKVNRI